MNKYAIRNKALGAVIGSAVGDALGAPFEFGPAGAYSRRFPTRVVGGVGEMVGGHQWQPGEFTDDTQMAIVQAESLLAAGRIDGQDLFQRFQVWATKAADVGIQTRAALASNAGWRDAAVEHFRRNPTRAAGNGSLMRSAPSAVFFAGDRIDDSMLAARELSAITHGDPAAGWGAAIFHAMIHAELNGGSAFAVLPDLLAALPDDQARYCEMLSPTWQPDDSSLPNGSVWGCLAQAVWSVRTTNTFEDAIVAAIDLGGDTDTVAAVAGGLAGAIYGIQNIPSRWTTYLNGTVQRADGARSYRLSDLQHLALSLIGTTPAGEQAAERAQGPGEIVPGVHAANLAGATRVPTDWAVVSLCRAGDRFLDHPVRREMYLVDQADGQNGDLRAAVLDAADTIDAFSAEGRNVVVHCHAGASRSGLVLRTWLMRSQGMTAHEATRLVGDRRPLLDTASNSSFTSFVNDSWPEIVV